MQLIFMAVVVVCLRADNVCVMDLYFYVELVDQTTVLEANYQSMILLGVL